MEEIQGQIKSVHKLTAELTQYLCEDESKIKLDDILHTFKTFCLNLNQAVEVSATCVNVMLGLTYPVCARLMHAIKSEHIFG